MREIKFRAFNKKEKKICRVVSTDFKNLVTVRFPEFDGLIGDFDDQMELVEFESLMQYTGLKDKNGVEIYEGDIILRRYYSPMFKQNVETKMAIEWDERDTSFGLWKEKIKYVEVIGNIYENSELLEESK